MTTDTLTLPKRTLIETAQKAHELATSIGEEDRILIEAADVEAMDGPTTMMLANIARTFASRGAPVAVDKPTSAFIDAFADLGLFEDLMKMEFRK